jgi:hypothetical protein
MTGEDDVAASFSCMKTVNTYMNEWVSESDVILKHHNERQRPKGQVSFFFFSIGSRVCQAVKGQSACHR